MRASVCRSARVTEWLTVCLFNSEHHHDNGASSTPWTEGRDCSAVGRERKREREKGVPDWSGSWCHVICAVMCRKIVANLFIGIGCSPPVVWRCSTCVSASIFSPARVSVKSSWSHWRRAKQNSRAEGGRGACHIEHALCANFLLSPSWQQRAIWESGIRQQEETRAEEESLQMQELRHGQYSEGCAPPSVSSVLRSCVGWRRQRPLIFCLFSFSIHSCSSEEFLEEDASSSSSLAFAWLFRRAYLWWHLLSVTHSPSFFLEDGIRKGLGVAPLFGQRRPKP